MLGTVACTVSFIVVMPKPTGTACTVHAALVSTLVGGVPFFSRPPLKAMLKHAASAAASSSSGFDPAPLSKRELKLYWPAIAPLSPLKLPFPVLSPPSQVAVAFPVGIPCLHCV